MNWKLKCTYLQQQITQLTSQLEDTQTLLDLNKQALNLGDNAQLSALQQEVILLKASNDNLKQERNLAMDRALISDQIAQSTESNENELIRGLVQQVRTLSKQQYIPQPLKDQQSGIIVHEKMILQPSQQIMELHQQIEMQNEVVLHQQVTIRKLLEQKQDLIKLNFSISNELIKNKMNPTHDHRDTELILQQLTQFQKRLLNNEIDDENSNSPMCSPLPCRISHNKSASIEKVPKLDLDKAKRIMEYNVKRMSQKQPNANDARVLTLMGEIVELRNQIHTMSIINSQMEYYSDDLNRQIIELQATNDTLIRSNQNYETKWAQFHKAFTQYRDYYKQNRDQTNDESILDMRASRVQPMDVSLIDQQF